MTRLVTDSPRRSRGSLKSNPDEAGTKCRPGLPRASGSRPSITLRRIASILVVLTALLATQANGTPPRPNILIIFTDDQGWADLGCYGNTKIKTPRLDRLAQEGTRFTSFYAQTICGASRAALLTGRYPTRLRGWIPPEEITFAELMKEVGYQTACIGKWDVSARQAILDRMPNAQGFQYYFGPLGANDDGIVQFYENNEPAGETTNMGSLLHLYTEKAIDYLQNRREKNRPFLLYLAHTMMHTIIGASPAFKGKSAGSLYGDVVEEFDYETGRLLDFLDQLGLSDDTLVIYTSDNGPWNQPAYTRHKKGHPKGSIFWGDAGPLRNGKGSYYEGGMRVPAIIRWPGKVPAGRVSDAIVATIDFLPTFAHLAGFEIPGDRIIDGIDQTDLFLGRTDSGRHSFLYGRAGVRQGKWKYLRAEHGELAYAKDESRPAVMELYDLEADIGEKNNLATQYPERVAELESLTQALIGLERPDD